MNSVKTLSIAIATAFAASSATAFEAKFDSSDVEYSYKNHNLNEKYYGDNVKDYSGSDHSLELGVKFVMDYNLFNDTTVNLSQTETTKKLKTAKDENVQDSHSNSISNEFGWKDSNLGKVSYTFGIGNNTFEGKTNNEHNHAIFGEAYFDLFTVGAEYTNGIDLTSKKDGLTKDESTENFALDVKVYPTDDIRVGYTRTWIDYAGNKATKDATNVVGVESWWLNGMLIAGADYTLQDESGKKEDVERSAHLGFRPLMLTDKVTFDLGYALSDSDEVYSFNVTLATYGVASSLKSDDR
jgi:hypothetical protein